jgi:hypothetical protein
MELNNKLYTAEEASRMISTSVESALKYMKDHNLKGMSNEDLKNLFNEEFNDLQNEPPDTIEGLIKKQNSKRDF